MPLSLKFRKKGKPKYTMISIVMLNMYLCVASLNKARNVSFNWFCCGTTLKKNAMKYLDRFLPSITSEEIVGL